jgi:hypothetical protein
LTSIYRIELENVSPPYRVRDRFGPDWARVGIPTSVERLPEDGAQQLPRAILDATADRGPS